MYLEEVWSNKKIDKLIKHRNLLLQIPLVGKYKGTDEHYVKKIENFKYGKKNGLSISVAHHCFGFFFSCYPALLSFALLGTLYRFYGDANYMLMLIIVATPIGLCYIPAYKAVFAKDCYLLYFKQFEKENEQWHKKWKNITLFFCIGAVFAIFLGIGVMWSILILL